MNTSFKEFDGRLRAIDRKAKAMSNGYTPKVKKNGLIEMEPAKRPLALRLPLKGLVLLLAGGLVYKAWLLNSLGAAGYAAKLTALSDGGAVEKAGAFLMQVDPATRMIADFIGPFIG